MSIMDLCNFLTEAYSNNADIYFNDVALIKTPYDELVFIYDSNMITLRRLVGLIINKKNNTLPNDISMSEYDMLDRAYNSILDCYIDSIEDRYYG